LTKNLGKDITENKRNEYGCFNTQSNCRSFITELTLFLDITLEPE